MPKLKTRRGAAKRFKVSAKGKLTRRKACKSHLLGKKRSKRKRALRKPTVVASVDSQRIRRQLGV